VDSPYYSESEDSSATNEKFHIHLNIIETERATILDLKEITDCSDEFQARKLQLKLTLFIYILKEMVFEAYVFTYFSHLSIFS
jgi:hypothetical protein